MDNSYAVNHSIGNVLELPVKVEVIVLGKDRVEYGVRTPGGAGITIREEDLEGFPDPQEPGIVREG